MITLEDFTEKDGRYISADGWDYSKEDAEKLVEILNFFGNNVAEGVLKVDYLYQIVKKLGR